ncbi:hypothetical protein PLICRDRAFT_33337 [Plicaturopsis crispa FD-325 SS-3]|nr:hypothetical protein PLICRDRAFT_33337 [Plicaturopsis crispa FD-325 SS-3]
MITTAHLKVLFLLSFSPLLALAATSPAVQAYTPTIGSCPDGFALVRAAGAVPTQTLSANESSYVSARKSSVLPGAWKAYLANVQATNTTLPDYVASILGNGSEFPTLGIATSGGGYRAASFGAGVLNALDGRNASAVSVGTGGLLQAATYLAGLSGGSWLVSSLAQANFPTLQDLALPNSNSTDATGFGGWLASFDLITPAGSASGDAEYIGGILEEVRGKHDAGFPVTINDVWARTLARHFANGTTAGDILDFSTPHGAGLTFSGIANVPSFVAHEQPFPIVVADMSSKSGNESTAMTAAGDIIPLTNPLIEFSVYEMGSYDPILAAFTPTQFLGTSNTSNCVTGYDQTSFVAGTSSELFNGFNVSATAFLNSTVGPIVAALEAAIPQSGVELDVARYPNPFFGVANGTFPDSGQEFLALVDGGEDGEVIPIQPLLVKARGVDVIFAIDATADINNFADGSSLVATQNRTTFFPGAYSFPPVPTNTSTFTASNLTSHPTFFGCDPSSADEPLLIYLANGAPPQNGAAPVTNISTDQVSVPNAQLQAILDQTFVIATQGFPDPNSGAQVDAEWPACLACAVVDRARNRTGAARSGVCASCFGRYCWNATSATTVGGSTSKSAGEVTARVSAVGVGGVVAAVLGSVVLLGW